MSDTFDRAWARLGDAIAAAESAAEEDRARLARVRQMRRAFLDVDVIGTLTHDIKDPLASLMMGLALVQRIGSGPGGVALANTCRAARRLDRIVDNVRQLEIARRGSYPVRARAFPLGSIVIETIGKFRTHPSVLGVVVESSIETPNVRAMGDPTLTTRILEELIDNAMGFSPPSGRVQVVLAVAKPHVVVSIRDEGSGIDPTHLADVFDETKNRLHQPRRGPGRGLPLASALAELQAGRISLEPNVPTGTIATLRLCEA